MKKIRNEIKILLKASAVITVALAFVLPGSTFTAYAIDDYPTSAGFQDNENGIDLYDSVNVCWKVYQYSSVGETVGTGESIIWDTTEFDDGWVVLEATFKRSDWQWVAAYRWVKISNGQPLLQFAEPSTTGEVNSGGIDSESLSTISASINVICAVPWGIRIQTPPWFETVSGEVLCSALITYRIEDYPTPAGFYGNIHEKG